MNRRNLLKYFGIGATGLLGTSHASASVVPAAQKLHAVWVHGTTVQVESPEVLTATHRAGWGTLFAGKPGTSSWFHISFSTPVIVSDVRPTLEKVFVFYKTRFASIRNVHIFDGENKVKAFDGLQLEGDRSKGIVATNTWQFSPPITIYYALGITLAVYFHNPIGTGPSYRPEFVVTTAGADFRL